MLEVHPTVDGQAVASGRKTVGVPDTVMVVDAKDMLPLMVRGDVVVD